MDWLRRGQETGQKIARAIDIARRSENCRNAEPTKTVDGEEAREFATKVGRCVAEGRELAARSRR